MSSNTFTWNAEQQAAIDNTLYKKSFCLIGAAGTGKTTTLKGAVTAAMEAHRIPPLDQSTKWLSAGAPGVVLLSYTRRAVRNIAKQMPEFLKEHCMTFHKVLEFEPEYYEEVGAEGQIINKMRFAPQRHNNNTLPATLSLVIVDEASMTSTDLFASFLDALPNPEAVQFIFLGDLNQLPPVYGNPVLGLKLLELPVVELTRVYRQALESPIISLALAVKDNNFASFNKDANERWGAPRHWDAKEVAERISLNAPGRGKVTIVPWKKDFEAEIALKAVASKIPQWVDEDFYNPDEDLMLCPWNLSFGTNELNKHIANTLAKRRKAVVWEVIAGFNKMYLAIGDRLMVEKQDALILEIYKNPKYMGVHPQSPHETLNRWGVREDGKKEVDWNDDVDVDDLLAAHDALQVEDRTAQCSHVCKVKMLDTDEVVYLDKAAQMNNSTLGYAMTVHKAQGSECRKVVFLTAGCHSAMLFRELVYTAITRAAEELVILCQPTMLARAAKRARIKGDTLQAKLEFFKSRHEERIR